MLNQIDIQDIVTIAKEAGNAIMQVYKQDFEVEYKQDSSPLTLADKKANDIIEDGLNKLSVSFPILSEEGKEIPYGDRKHWEYFWLVDPLDGTKEFVKKNGEFTVNIALIYKDTPVLGVVYAPAIDKLYWAKKDEGAYLNSEKLPLKTNKTPEDKLFVVASKSHLSTETQKFIDNLKSKEIEQVSKGSSLKLCMVAEGSADIYPRLAPTMEWDTAAADAVVRTAGKMTYQFKSNEPVIYNKENLLNPWFIVK